MHAKLAELTAKSPELRQHPQGHLDAVRAPIWTLKDNFQVCWQPELAAGPKSAAFVPAVLRQAQQTLLCLQVNMGPQKLLLLQQFPSQVLQYPFLMKNEPLTALESNSQRDEVSTFGAEVPCPPDACTKNQCFCSILILAAPLKIILYPHPPQNILKPPEKSAVALPSQSPENSFIPAVPKHWEEAPSTQALC